MSDNKEITALVKAVRKTLKNQHGMDVPHTALRASLLTALGEHPHAFAKKADTAAKPKKTPTSKKHFGPWVKLTLAEIVDEAGRLQLSLEDEDNHVVPPGFDLSGAIVVQACQDEDLTPEKHAQWIRDRGLQGLPGSSSSARSTRRRCRNSRC